MQVTERRKWYIGFGVILILMVALLILLHANWYWIFGLLGFLLVVAVYDRGQKKHTLLRNFPVLGWRGPKYKGHLHCFRSTELGKWKS